MGYIALEIYDIIWECGKNTQLTKREQKLYFNPSTIPWFTFSTIDDFPDFGWLNVGNRNNFIIKKSDLPPNLLL